MTHTPISDAALTREWPDFAEEVEYSLDKPLQEAFQEMRTSCYARLLRGKQEYGDGSFHLRVDALLDEIKQEYADAFNWSFIAWVGTQDAALLCVAMEAVRGYAQTVRAEEYLKSLPRSIRRSSSNEM